MRGTAVRVLTLVVASLMLVPGTARPAAGQVEVERVLRRFGAAVITRLDVRQARLLEFYPEATTDELVLRELENRHLILGEVSLFPPDEPDPLDVARVRADWISRVGAAADLTERLARAGMTVAVLDAWFRDDLRMEAYIDLRFGAMPEADRPAAIDNWIDGMRRLAGLR